MQVFASEDISFGIDDGTGDEIQSKPLGVHRDRVERGEWCGRRWWWCRGACGRAVSTPEGAFRGNDLFGEEGIRFRVVHQNSGFSVRGLADGARGIIEFGLVKCILLCAPSVALYAIIMYVPIVALYAVVCAPNVALYVSSVVRYAPSVALYAPDVAPLIPSLRRRWWIDGAVLLQVAE